jgi:hypothetical protein
MARFNYFGKFRALIERRIQSAFNYGAIEGVLYIDGEPAPPGAWVTCDFVNPWRDEGFAFDGKRRKTSAGGRFRFSRVPAGEAGLGRCHCDIKGCPNDVERRVEVRTRETTFVELGKGAGRIKGQFAFPEGLTETPAWENVPLIWIQCLGPDPEHIEGRLLEYSGDWRRTIYSSDIWKQDDLRWCLVRVDGSGAFEVSGLQPGHYGLKIEDGVQNDGLFEPSAIGFYDFFVGHASSDVLDVGTVVLPLAALEERGEGDLEGQVLVGGMPATSGTPVRCEVSLDFCDEYPNARLRCFWFIFDEDRHTKTDEMGHFSFKNLPAGSARVGLPHDASDGELSGELEVQLLKGKTVSVTVEVGDAEQI